MTFLAEFWAFLNQRKKLWLAPVMFLLIALGGIIILAKGSVIAPFIYAIF